MDAHDFARLAALIAAERSTVDAALVGFRAHRIGLDWRGRSRHQAEFAHHLAVETCVRSLAVLDDAEREALRLWRAALATNNPLGV
jgi:hypothetical protein